MNNVTYKDVAAQLVRELNEDEFDTEVFSLVFRTKKNRTSNAGSMMLSMCSSLLACSKRTGEK